MNTAQSLPTINRTPIPLWSDSPPGLNPGWRAKNWTPSITPFLLDTKKSAPIVIVFPGGGYHARAEHEREPIARFFNDAGYHAAILDYRTQFHDSPAPLTNGPLLDAQRAIRLVRARADSWRVRQDRIAIIGFSAGGHLAAMLATHCDNGDLLNSDAVERCGCRPDAAILSYAAILPHPTLIENLIGAHADPDDYNPYRPDQHVTQTTPPMFLWHTATDTGVPPANSVAMAQALWENGVRAELHIFPEGHHGLGLAEQQPHVAQWAGLCTRWLRAVGFVTPSVASGVGP